MVLSCVLSVDIVTAYLLSLLFVLLGWHVPALTTTTPPAPLRSTQADIDAPAVQAGKKAYCSRLDNSTLDPVMDYIWINESRSDADDLQCELPPFNGTVEVR